MNWNKGSKGNKIHLFRKLGIYDKIGKKKQHKFVAFQSQWCNSYRFTFYFKAHSLHLKRHFAKLSGSYNNIKINWRYIYLQDILYKECKLEMWDLSKAYILNKRYKFSQQEEHRDTAYKFEQNFETQLHTISTIYWSHITSLKVLSNVKSDRNSSLSLERDLLHTEESRDL